MSGSGSGSGSESTGIGSDLGNANGSTLGRRKLRTRTGCITCRIRRVKCDETKPSCRRCIASKRVCDGYLSDPTASSAGNSLAPSASISLSRRDLAAAVRALSAHGRPGLPAAHLLAGPQVPSDHAACFDFFRLRTAPTTGSFFASDFWDQRVLQMAHAEPAVWNAAAALGALHRRWELAAADAPVGRSTLSESSDTSDRDSPQPQPPAAYAYPGQEFAEQADVCYGRAMARARDIQDPAVLLVLSLALAAVANLSGRFADAQVHLRSGQQLLMQLRDQVRDHHGRSLDVELAATADTLARLDLESMTFSDQSAPYSFPQIGPPDTLSIFESPAGDDGGVSRGQPVHKINAAAVRILGLLRRILVLAARQEDWVPVPELVVSPEDRAEEAAIHTQLRAWEVQLATFLDAVPPADLARHETAVLTLKIFHACSRMLLRVVFLPQAAWDDVLPECERVVAVAAALLQAGARVQPLVPCVVSLDPGVLPPLFLVASRCRHPVLRRRALALLWKAKRHEGRWQSAPAAMVAERIIALEEDGLGVGIPLRVFCAGSDVLRVGEEIRREVGTAWLRKWEKWTARSTWEGMVRVPKGRRMIDVQPVVDVEARTVDLLVLMYDADSLEGYTTHRWAFNF